MKESTEILSEELAQFKAPVDGTFNLNTFSTSWNGEALLNGYDGDSTKKRAKKYLKDNLKALSDAQELLWASNVRSMLLVFQAMDAGGKDSTIKHVMSGVNPQGVEVYSFKRPSAEELDHNFLWRYWRRMPERGRIGIFNRSYYEEVLVVKVHPEILENRPIPYGIRGEAFWEARYQDINNMEQHLCRSGTVILKFFLNVSKEEQKNRFLDRLTEEDKHWKFSESDVHERQYWPQYMQAFEEAIQATSTPWAPWFVIPADNKWIMRALVANIITQYIESLDLSFPEVTEEKKIRLMEVKRQLEQE